MHHDGPRKKIQSSAVKKQKREFLIILSVDRFFSPGGLPIYGITWMK